MKIKLDENLPEDLVARLIALGHDVESVREEGLAGESDEVVRRAASDEGRFLVTQDVGMADLRDWETPGHAGVMLVRVNPDTREALNTVIMNAFSQEGTEEWIGRIVVVTNTKVRVRS